MKTEKYFGLLRKNFHSYKLLMSAEVMQFKGEKNQLTKFVILLSTKLLRAEYNMVYIKINE